MNDATPDPTPTHYRLEGLAEPVEILVDRWGIPHIYAGSTDDLFFAQGFNAARARLFQLDLWRRRGIGELAAAFGPAYVEHDRAARLLHAGHGGPLLPDERAGRRSAAMHRQYASTPAPVTSGGCGLPRCRG